MKQLILSFFVLMTLVSCSKSDSDKGRTFITITNNFGTPLENVAVGVLLTTSKTELVGKIDFLEQNEVSSELEVKNKDTDNVLIFFDRNDKTYMIMQPYAITQEAKTSLTITSIVNVSEIQKTADIYPK